MPASDDVGDQAVTHTSGIFDEVAAHNSDALPDVAGVVEEERERGSVGGGQC